GRAARRRGRRALPPDRAADGSAIRALRILKPRSDALPRRFRSAPNRPASRRQGLPAYPLSTPRAAGRTSVDDTTRPPALSGTTYCHPVANANPSHLHYERLPGRWPALIRTRKTSFQQGAARAYPFEYARALDPASDRGRGPGRDRHAGRASSKRADDAQRRPEPRPADDRRRRQGAGRDRPPARGGLADHARGAAARAA